MDASADKFDPFSRRDLVVASKSIATWLNENNIRTRDGRRLGWGAVHQVLTRTSRDHKMKTRKPDTRLTIAV